VAALNKRRFFATILTNQSLHLQGYQKEAFQSPGAWSWPKPIVCRRKVLRHSSRDFPVRALIRGASIRRSPLAQRAVLKASENKPD
jgi:hypothetical protein